MSFVGVKEMGKFRSEEQSSKFREVLDKVSDKEVIPVVPNQTYLI